MRRENPDEATCVASATRGDSSDLTMMIRVEISLKAERKFRDKRNGRRNLVVSFFVFVASLWAVSLYFVSFSVSFVKSYYIASRCKIDCKITMNHMIFCLLPHHVSFRYSFR